MKSYQNPELSHDGGRYHIETSPLICSANQWTGFYMITVSVKKELNSAVTKLICLFSNGAENGGKTKIANIFNFQISKPI